MGSEADSAFQTSSECKAPLLVQQTFLSSIVSEASLIWTEVKLTGSARRLLPARGAAVPDCGWGKCLP